MTTAKTNSTLEKILSLLPDARETENGWTTNCPAHRPGSSLSGRM